MGFYAYIKKSNSCNGFCCNEVFVVTYAHSNALSRGLTSVTKVLSVKMENTNMKMGLGSNSKAMNVSPRGGVRCDSNVSSTPVYEIRRNSCKYNLSRASSKMLVT
jgi:hypothetical protein